MAGIRTLGFAGFTEFAAGALAGRRPYPYQQRLAEEGLPEFLRVPTGAGKTAAAVLPWLWRRMRFPNSVQDRLVYVLPLRSMAEQTERQITAWLERLGLAATVPVVTLTGGESSENDTWRLYPRQPAILLGTQDMLLSRLLMRGYGEWQASWPMTFGLLHCCSQFVFDETQLLGPGLQTSAQLQGLREALGSTGDSATMWMSATASPADLATADHREPVRAVELGPADFADEELARRLATTRTVRRATLPADPEPYPAALARALADWHVAGAVTIAMVNTPERAVAVYDELERAAHAADLLLLHARFRPQERSITAALLDSPVPSAGRIVVATQVLEATVDVSCQTMFTELAPWSSIVQRAGRCNRAGELRDGVLRWARPPGERAAEPYGERSIAAAEAALTDLEGTSVTTSALRDRPVKQDGGGPQEHAGYPVLRRRDLLQLFDTWAPDLGAAGTDITPWVGAGEDLTAFVAWRFWPDGEPAVAEPAPASDELCPAPLAALRTLATPYWICDQIDGRWRRCVAADVRPGVILLADAAAGGYLPDRGWSPGSRAAVPVVTARPASQPLASAAAPWAIPSAPRGISGRLAVGPAVGSGAGPGGEPAWSSAGGLDAIDRDPASFIGRWVDLRTHLADAERELRALTEDWRHGLAPGQPPSGFTPGQLEAAALAARFHDLGKAFRYFQDFLCGDGLDGPPGDGPWAKAPGRGGRHKSRPYLRHELVTALTLLHPLCRLLDGAPEPDLVVYLAAAHHGMVRLRVGMLPDESAHDPPRIMGVQAGDELPRVALWEGAEVPALTLDTGVLGLAGGARPDSGCRTSWTARMMALRDRPDLGPFRLAFLEALVRIADLRASRAPSDGTPLDSGAERQAGDTGL